MIASKTQMVMPAGDACRCRKSIRNYAIKEKE